MAININAKTTGVGGLETSADNSGNINIQSGGTTVMSVTSSGVAVTGSFSQNGAVYSTQPTFRNLIINGDMRIDQRNTGSAVTVNANSVFFPVDRFHAVGVGSAGVFTAQQVSDSPDGGDKSLKFTVTTTAASGAYRFHYNIEGNHIAHLGFGQSWAKTFTLSFWVKSSVTGTYTGSFRNSANDRSYVFEYTIDASNTWERKTITITADTSGTWLTDNGSGLKIVWALANALTTTAGSWQSGNYFASANQTNWIATSGATFYISQIQLEIGEGASDFEFLPYDVQLQRCQRYYYRLYDTASGGNGRMIGTAFMWSTTAIRTFVTFPVTMRDLPSVESSNFTDAFSAYISSVAKYLPSLDVAFSGAESTRGCLVSGTITVEATSGDSGYIRFNSTSGAKLAFSAEL